LKYSTTYLIIFLAVVAASGQKYHSCPFHGNESRQYKNPLYDRWLSCYDVKFYDLLLSVSNENTVIEGRASIRIEPVTPMDTLVLELQEALEVSDVVLKDEILGPDYFFHPDFLHDQDVIYIPLDRVRDTGESFVVTIGYGGEAGQNRGFFAGITSATDPEFGFNVTYTLSEPLNAKDWFPVKQVLEDKIDSVWMRIECGNHLMAASNGLLVKIEQMEGMKHVFHWKTRYPIAYYLLSIAVADYRDFSFHAPLREDSDSVLVQNYIYDSDLVFLEYEKQIRDTGPMITTFSELLINYPFSKEKYGHAMAPMGGGMEHQTMTTIHGFRFFLVAHELAHQWFGDYVTCGNWQDIWINEGFASYMEYVAAQQLMGQEAADGWMSNAMSIALGETAGSVFVPVDQVEDTYRLFDYGLSYKKGAILLHMIRYRIDDDELFFGILRKYLTLFGDGLATGADFLEILEGESGMEFSCFFDQWYYGEGYPGFNLHWYQHDDSLQLRSEQSSTAPGVTPLFETPFDIEIRYTGGATERVRFFQDEPVEEFSHPVSGLVEDILFDPDNFLLKKVSVIHREAAERMIIYGPNPVTDRLHIRLRNAGQIDDIMITSISGQEVYRSSDADNPLTVDLSFLSAGPYMLVLSDPSGTYMERIVKIGDR